MWVEVTDTGPGIAEESLPRVFDRFFRANLDVEGTGLGLSIVKSITQKYGGEAVIRNRRDGRSGVVAAVSFPLAGTPAGSLGSHNRHKGTMAKSAGADPYPHRRDA